MVSVQASPGDPACTLPVSFELYPPRSDAAAIALGRSIDRLAEADPAFISVTFGAGGSTRDRSLTVLSYILENTRVQPMAHLTCIGSSAEEANQLVRRFLDAGITSFLALRGDPPTDGTREHDGDLKSAAELVQLIHRVQQEREPFRQQPLPGANGAAARLRARPRPERVAVAAFPTGHPRARSAQQEIDSLLAKQAAGANLAITQLFYRADEYLGFVERARAGGVSIDILPGIMPATSAARLRRIAELTGEHAPDDLLIALEIEPTDEGRAKIATEFFANLAAEVIAGAAPGLHLYTLNKHEAVLAVLARLGRLPATASAIKENA
ncbi:methylenetetrahydrofolate reductase [Rathayibacter sp. YIM 133350]|uniref:methylenetetrahydrofolate reductase n=1 Tax=Rathayibacter sp. YIM 133350 TaxID=3131992 RepID=UPI00307DC156